MVSSTIPHVPGERVPAEFTRTLRRQLSSLLGRHNDNFPGSQPISFAQKHLQQLQQEDYFVCEKSDGIRCLMFLTQQHGREITYFVDRKNDFYWQQGMHFPHHEDSTFQRFHIDTVADGELVLDDVGTARERMRFLVFDSLLVDGKVLLDRTLDKRLGYFRELVFKPYEELLRKFPEEQGHMPFTLSFKQMEYAYALDKVFSQVIPRLHHGNDGLIFTARTSPYTCGTDTKILKWKPAELNSVDFRLYLEFPMDDTLDDGDAAEMAALDYDAKPVFKLGIWLGDTRYKQFDHAYVPDEQWHDFQTLQEGIDESVVECCMDQEKRWRIERFRTDKHNGNHHSVVESILESIRDAVTNEQLLGTVPAIKAAWKERDTTKS